MTAADALTIGMHAISQIRHEVQRDPNIDDEQERQSRLDELDQAHVRLSKLRAVHFATPSYPRASGGAASVDPILTTPTADAECAEPADSTG